MQEEKPHIAVVPDDDLGNLQCCFVQCSTFFEVCI